LGLGLNVGFGVGLGVGLSVGLGVGFSVGVGLGVGFSVGSVVGFGVRDGACVGEGFAVAEAVNGITLTTDSVCWLSAACGATGSVVGTSADLPAQPQTIAIITIAETAARPVR